VAADERLDDDRAWSPIGALSGLAERFGGAVSETIGIDVDTAGDRNGGARTADPTSTATTTPEDRA
jgi:hypothetical protein